MDIRLLVCADTHLGFDEPIRPRVERRRRGPDFFANFQRVLDGARERRVDLVIHGGDLFFRSRVPAAIVDRAYAMLVRFVEQGIPILIVPGNHERSLLPSSLLLSHPRISVFTRPETKIYEFAGGTLACAGFPCVRDGVRGEFASRLAATGWADADAGARLLCLHQTIEGAQVGPADYTFRAGEDVIPMEDVPPEFDAVLAGHIHRRQILTRRRPDGSLMPVVYPGSTERTSFAEQLEPKGWFDLTLGDSLPRGRRQVTLEFRSLPARPMEDLVLDGGVTVEGLRSLLGTRLARLAPDSSVRLSCTPGVPGEVRRALTGVLLREVCPPAMNIQFGAGLFDERRRRDR